MVVRWICQTITLVVSHSVSRVCSGCVGIASEGLADWSRCLPKGWHWGLVALPQLGHKFLGLFLLRALTLKVIM